MVKLIRHSFKLCIQSWIQNCQHSKTNEIKKPKKRLDLLSPIYCVLIHIWSSIVCLNSKFIYCRGYDSIKQNKKETKSLKFAY